MDAEAARLARRTVMPESDAQAAARARAEQVLPVPSPEVGALLRLLAGAVGARHAVEIGSAGGVTAGYLVPAMGERGVLTTIEADSHRHALATAAHAELGVADQVRAILGDARDVLGRLSDGQYDLAVLQSPAAGQLAELRRLLRPGGLLAILDVLDGSDAATALLEQVGMDDGISAAVLPLDGGVLVGRTLPGD